jgi:hypothetical protein
MVRNGTGGSLPVPVKLQSRGSRGKEICDCEQASAGHPICVFEAAAGGADSRRTNKTHEPQDSLRPQDPGQALAHFVPMSRFLTQRVPRISIVEITLVQGGNCNHVSNGQEAVLACHRAPLLILQYASKQTTWTVLRQVTSVSSPGSRHVYRQAVWV